MNTARLIARTMPVAGIMSETGIPMTTADEVIGYCARVSNPKNQHNHKTAAKLLLFLLREKHWSPFEMVHAVLEIETTRDIARQVLRHRSFSFQEFSLRYAEALRMIKRKIRRQDLKNRQNSIDDLPAWKHWLWERALDVLIWFVALIYSRALKLGIAKETARSILPEGLTPTRLYMAGSLRSFIHYLDVRKGNGTQAEHIDLANSVEAALHQAFPETMAAIYGTRPDDRGPNHAALQNPRERWGKDDHLIRSEPPRPDY